MTYTNALKRQLTAVNREITDSSESGNTRRNAQFFFMEEAGGERRKKYQDKCRKQKTQTDQEN